MASAYPPPVYDEPNRDQDLGLTPAIAGYLGRCVLLSLIVFYIFQSPVFAQCDTLPQATRWESRDRDYSYLDFTDAIEDGGPPVVVTSDSTGIRGRGEHLSVLSYANGKPKYIFNGHQLRRGSDYALLAGGVAVGADSTSGYRSLGESVYQHTMLPLPGDTNQIYIFHCWAYRTPSQPADSAWENNLPAMLTIYDADLDSFTLRDSILHTRATESWAAMRHPDGQSWWLATRVHSPSGIRIYKLTSQGLEADVYSLGGSDFGWRETEEAAGIAFSPSGQHIGWAERGSVRTDTIAGSHWIIDFDCATGQASHPVQIDGDLYPGGGSSVAFSPQGQYMYGIKDDSTGFIFEHDIHRYQVDLSGGHEHGSSEHIFNSERNRGVTLGPDGRVYGGPNSALKYIEYPDRWQALTDTTTLGYPGGAICTTLPPDPFIDQGLNPQQAPIDLPLLRLPRLGGDNFVSCGDTSQYLILENCYQELAQVSYQLGPGITLIEDRKPQLILAFDTLNTLDPQRYIALVNDHPCRTYRDTFWVYVEGCEQECEPVFSTAQVVACDSALVHGVWQYSSGEYTETFQGYGGCDSTSAVDLLIHPSQTISSTLTACDSALVHGLWETTGGDYAQTFEALNGCDSTSTVELTLASSQASTEVIEACDSALVHGQWIYASGEYTETFESFAGCDSTSTVELSVEPSPIAPGLPRDTVLMEDAVYVIDLGQSAVSPLRWSPPSAVDCDTCRSVSIEPGFAGRLSLEQGVAPCIVEREVNIAREGQSVNDVWQTPDAFSPNGDGINDYFEVALPAGAELLELAIYNRWGSQVYASSCPCMPNGRGLIETWDGTERGKPVNPGGYAYLGSIRLRDGTTEQVKGSVVVIK